MTKHERSFFTQFSRDVLRHDLYLPTNTFDSPKGHISLFNPGLSFFYLLQCFEGYRQNKNIKNVVDPRVYETLYYSLDRFEQPYFFSSSFEKIVLLSQQSLQNVTGLLGEFEENEHQTMTAPEAVLYVLYRQYIGEMTAFENSSIVTLTKEGECNIPLVIGFDENEICNSVRFYNAREMMNMSIGLQEVHSQVAL